MGRFGELREAAAGILTNTGAKICTSKLIFKPRP
jgi:hypothetical protein